MWHIRGIYYMVLLACLSLAPVTGSEAATYTITEDQLTQLEQTFSELKSQQTEQERLLMEQQAQIENYRKATADWEARLNEANQSLSKYEARNKATEERLERQRNTAYAIALIAMGWAVSRR